MVSSANGNRVIIAAQCNDHTVHLTGVSSYRFYTDALTFARAQLLVTEYYGFDTPNNYWDVYNIEAEAMGQTIIYHPDGIPDADRSNPLLKSIDDWKIIRVPDPYETGRMKYVHEINRIYIDMTGKPAHCHFCAPFSLAVNIRGYENLIDDIYERPQLVHDLFRFLCDDILAPYIEAIRSETGMPTLLADGNDAWASPPMITLDMIDEYVVGYAEYLREKVHGKLVTRGNWGDASSRDPDRFMAQKLSCSPGFLSALDPDLFRLGPARVKAFANQRGAFVTAGIDAKLLRDGPVTAIVERIKYYLDNMARDGRCAIYLNQVPAEAPSQHIHAAVAACRAYGRLPMPDDLDDVDFQIPKRESFAEFLQDRGGAI